MDEIELGDHLCMVYDDEREKIYWLTLFIAEGLKEREIVVIIDEDEDELIRVMGEVMDVSGFLAKGQLIFLSRDESFLKDGYFNPDGMLELIAEFDEKALREGHKGVRIASNGNWILRYPKIESFLEYDAKLNRFLPLTKCTSLCLFDERKFGADLLLKILQIHPKVMQGGEIRQNPNYVPPERFLKGLWKDEPIRKLVDRKIRREFEEVERRFKLLFESPFEAIFVLRGSKILSCNSTAIRILGFQRYRDIIGKELYTLLPEDSKGVFEKRIRAATREPQFFEISFARADGGLAFLEVSLTRVNSGIFMLIARDITERKEMEEALKESEERYRLLVDSSIDAIITINSEARIIGWNKGAERIYGYRAEEIIGKPLTILIPERFRDRFLRGFKSISGTHVPGKYLKAKALRKDGKEIPVEMSYYSWKSKRGIFYTAIVREK